jgi:hypothetical protein
MIGILNGTTKLYDVFNPNTVGAAERLLQDGIPKLTVAQGYATATEPVTVQAFGPKVVEFANGQAPVVGTQYLT